jgi:hypothetical protein
MMLTRDWLWKTSLAKKVTRSATVQRQDTKAAKRVGNCQIGKALSSAM